MPSYLTLLRTLCVFTLLCLLGACKKNDPWPPKPDDCNCDAERFTALYSDSTPVYPHRGYRFDKTYKADGSIDKFYLNAIAPGAPYEYVAYFKKTANWAYLLDSASQDTILRVELNSKKLPVRSYMRDPFGLWGPWQYYTYNSKDLLVKLEKYDNTGTYSVQYDQYGNVLTYVQDRDNTVFIGFTYDYHTPIKGGSYFWDDTYGAFLELQILQLLGLLPNSPHHKMLTATSYSDEPTYNRTFANQQINSDGYVTYYETSLWHGNDLLKCTTSWHCNGKQSPQKY